MALGYESRKKLRDICIELSKNNVYLTLSNSDTAIIRSLYATSFFAIDEVRANRAINCNGAKRGKITELVITNYPVESAILPRLLEQRLTC
ncbi:MAG: hypothetical protein KatS3mg052_2658 [Candidatus Roseilinea sp.]|nr:MAG: hypothetical protein KatS3mg052_2658 [Candidatus Roseilinea sp.]